MTGVQTCALPICTILECQREIRSFHKYQEGKKIKELVAKLENILNEAETEDIR